MTTLAHVCRHNVVLEIQSSMPSPPKTYRPYMKGVYLAYSIVAWCYFGVSFTGYHSFGNNVEDNVLASIPGPKWMIAMADFFVVIHVIGSEWACSTAVMASRPPCMSAVHVCTLQLASVARTPYTMCEQQAHKHLDEFTQLLCF